MFFRPILYSFLILLNCDLNAQVDHSFVLNDGVFLSAYGIHKEQWVCGMQVSSVDSTNMTLNARFDLLKDWEERDSLICTLHLDTTQTYLQKIDNIDEQTLRYYSQDNDVIVFLRVPTKYEYDLSNDLHGVLYEFGYARIDLPKKWKRHRKGFTYFYEK